MRCNETNPQADAEDDNESLANEHTSQEVQMVVGSYSEVTEGLAIRHAEEDGFDLSSTLLRVDAAIPGAAAIADAVNQYGYALVRFPEGKSWTDLMERKTPGYEGWKHFATYDAKGGVSGGNAAIRQAGLQPVAVANIAMQGMAMATGLAYMAKLDNALTHMNERIDSIIKTMEEEYLSELEGHAVSLAEYSSCFDEYSSSSEERTSVITDTRRILSDLQGYWRKEMRRIEDLRARLSAQGKSIKEADAKELLREYKGIDERMRFIFRLIVAARQVLLQYTTSFTSRRLKKDRSLVESLRDDYLSARESAFTSFESLASQIKVPLLETMPQALAHSVKPTSDLKPLFLGYLGGGAFGAAAVGVTRMANRTGRGVDEQTKERRAQFLAEAQENVKYVERVTKAYELQLDKIEFRFSKANALLISPDGVCALEVEDDKVPAGENDRTDSKKVS